jgi:hypothetical protein
MLPGQHVTAVFGFCDIRQFGELTDVLRGQVRAAWRPRLPPN